MAIPQAEFSPNRQYQSFSGPIAERFDLYEATLTTGGGAQTLTAAQLLGGIAAVNCDDAQTLNLPTAALLNAALQGPVVGLTIRWQVINIGDATLTIGVGTGGDATVGNAKDTVLTIVANASKEFYIRVTGVALQGDPSTSDSYVVYGTGSTAAATA